MISLEILHQHPNKQIITKPNPNLSSNNNGQTNTTKTSSTHKTINTTNNNIIRKWSQTIKNSAVRMINREKSLISHRQIIISFRISTNRKNLWKMNSRCQIKSSRISWIKWWIFSIRSRRRKRMISSLSRMNMLRNVNKSLFRMTSSSTSKTSLTNSLENTTSNNLTATNNGTKRLLKSFATSKSKIRKLRRHPQSLNLILTIFHLWTKPVKCMNHQKWKSAPNSAKRSNKKKPIGRKSRINWTTQNSLRSNSRSKLKWLRREISWGKFMLRCWVRIRISDQGIRIITETSRSLISSSIKCSRGIICYKSIIFSISSSNRIC